eukprot:g27754.t1
MWEQYRFVKLLLRKYTIASVAAWDWAVRSLSKLGEWHKGTLFSELCHVHLVPLSNAYVDVSGGKPIVRAMYVAMAKIVGFRHSCPACPGKKDHRKDTCPNSTSTKWDLKKPKQG